MKTMHVVRIVLMVVAMALPLTLVPAHAQDKASDRTAQLTPGSPGSVAPARGLAPGAKLGSPRQQAKASPRGGSAEDIKDIRGPRDIPNPWMWALYAAGIFLGLLVLYVAWRILRRRKELVRLAHERAFEALERARKLMQPQNAREFSYQLSAAVRTYIEERFAVRSTQQTTSEFLRCVSEQDSGPLAAQRILLAEFLKNCDLVKFARWALTEGEMEAMFQSAWQFVDATKPALEGSGDRSPVSGHRSLLSRVRSTLSRRRQPDGTDTGQRSSGLRSSDTGHRTPVPPVTAANASDTEPRKQETGANPLVGGVS